MEIWAVLVGVAAATVAQWVIGPIVEARVRGQERWEHDVLELGALLSQRARALNRRAWSDYADWGMLEEQAEAVQEHLERDVNDIPTGVRIEIDNARRTALGSISTYHDLVTIEVRWLVSRVSAGLLDETSFAKSWRRYRRDVEALRAFMPPEDDDDRAELKRAWESEPESRTDLLAEVEQLASLIGPPLGLGHDLRRLWRRVRHPLRWRTMNRPRTVTRAPSPTRKSSEKTQSS